MSTDAIRNLESDDAKQVDAAVEVFLAGDLDKAEAMLKGVVANTPLEYSNSYEDDEGLSIKFWDQAAFIHYVTWQSKQGQATKNISWISNAYPRAYYYLGFICVKKKQFHQAIKFLEKGQALEPTNPKFIFEKAQALTYSNFERDALTLYNQVTELSPYVSARDLAIAHRGRGFVLIEMGDLDAAEDSFQTSLKIQPGNNVAISELQYIDHLRQGGAAGGAEAVRTWSPNVSNCAVCGQTYDKGVVISFEGKPVAICERCERKLTKKWWEFWK